MPTTTHQTELASRLAALETGMVSKTNAGHQAYLADIARIGREQAEAVKTASGYSPALGCFYSPKAAVAFLNGQIAADRAASALKMAAE